MTAIVDPADPDQTVNSGALSGKTSRAGMWAIGGKLVGKVIDLATFVVLSNYLTPHDLGLVAIAMTAVFVIEAVLDLPIAAALIRIKEPDETLYQTALTLGLLRGIGIALLLAGLAWPIAYFYREPLLVPVVLVLSLAPALRGLMSPKMIIFARRFDFTKDFAIDIVAKSAAFLVAFTMVSVYGSYWAIAAATVTTPFVMVILSYMIAPMRPILSLMAWPQLSNTIGWNSLAQIVSAVNWQLDRILLPRFISISDFGKFAVATDLSAVPHQTLSQPLVRPLIAAFASVEPGDPMRQVYRKASGVYFLLVAPIFLLIGVTATPLLKTMIGTEWMDAGWILSWLVFNAILTLPGNLIYPLAIRLDLSRFIAIRMVVEFAVRLPLTGIGIWAYGITGALASQTVTAIVVLCVTAWSVHKMIGLSVWQFVTAFARPAIGVIACLAASYLLYNHVSLTGEELYDNLRHAGVVVTLTTLYLLTTMILWLVAGRPDGAERAIARMMSRRLGAVLANRPE